VFIRFLSMILHLCSLQGEPYVYAISKTPLLVVDEADRMIEKGHFEELDKLLERMKRSAGNSYSAKNNLLPCLWLLFCSCDKFILFRNVLPFIFRSSNCHQIF